ncbi:uncharacterized protein LOC110048061 [Orbicella faveolata]|uniref:uncharacterized protein LOC110048061 n=1 Tax=Orbicella faveolata TaxID=48498 RepID=UPI0009E2AEA8|nr:uncharacterized protein LOC110048061 [Orbicella faveolata]
MPEVQFNQLSTDDEDSAVCYDRGILLQTITQAQVQHTVPLDVTVCHGSGIISAPNNDPEASRANPNEETEDTKCRSSVLSSDFDQTRLFGGDTGTDLDITCSQQEVFFRDYPAQLLSSESLEQSGKMDSKSFLMSLGSKPSSTQTHEVIQHTKDYMTPTTISNAYCKRQPLGDITDVQSAMKTSQGGGDQQSNVDENVESTACHSYKGLENSVSKTMRRSIYEPLGIDVTSCYGPGADQTEVNNTDNTESLDLTACQAQEEHDSDENLELTACHSYEVLDSSIPKTHQKSICEPAELDVTSCYGPGVIKGCSLSLSTHQNDQSLSCNSSRKMDSSVFLQSLGSKQHSNATDNDEYDDEMDLTISGNIGTLTEGKTEQKTAVEPKSATFLCAKTSEVVTDLSNSTGFRNAYLIKNPFKKTTDQQEQTSKFHENLELTVCHSQPVLDSDSQRTKRRSLYEAADLEVTSCYGPGLIKSPEKEETSNNLFKSALNLSRSLRAASNANKLNGNAVFNKAQDLPGWNKTQQQESDFNDNLDLTTCHSRPFMGNNSLKTDRRSLFGPADIDVTSCHGLGLVESSGNNLELTVRGQPGLDNGLQQASRRSLCYEPADIDVTSCHGVGLVESSGNSVELTVRGQPSLDDSLQKANRRSFYEPADIDVTSCHGLGLVKSFVETSESTVPLSQHAIDNNAQKINRRSVYEPADLDVTSCQGTGLVKSSGESLELTRCHREQVLDNSTQKVNRQSLYEPADLDVTSCHGSGLVKANRESLQLTTYTSEQVLDNNTENGTRQSVYEHADLDVTSCPGPGLVKSNRESLQLTTYTSEQVFDNNIENGTRQSVYEHADLDVTSCRGSGLVKANRESLQLTTYTSEKVFDNNTENGTRQSVYEHADLDVTSCHGPGLVKSNRESLQLTTCIREHVPDDNTENATRRSFYERADLDVTSCHGPGLRKSDRESLQLTTCTREQVPDDKTENGTRRSFYQHADLRITSGSESDLDKTPNEPVITGNAGKTRLNLTERTEASFHRVSANASLDKVKDFHYTEEVLQTARAPTDSNTSFEYTDYSADNDETSAPAVGLNQSIGDQITSDVDRQLSIICEESVSELSKKELREDGNVTELEEMQNTTQSPITLKKFLDITELAFITEVNMRRSIAPSNVVETPQTPKDMIISTLVSKPKAACYEEAIPALESEITVMKEKVEQQEMELNASNPRVFMEAQSASTEELLAMQGKVRRLRSVCEKTSKREWKEGKGQLNKRILLKMTENHQVLASDVHVVEESLVMVDDCHNLLDKMDNDLDEGIKGFQLSLEENEKKLQEQAITAAELENMTETLRKSEQELADLECARSTVQSEKQELSNRKEQLDVAILENEEAICLLKKKDPRSGKTATKEMSQKLDILESLQEWSLEEWNEERARFTFLKSTLEMVVLFGSDIANSKDSFPNQEVKSIQLNFTPTEQFRGKMGKVHTLVKQAVNQDLLSQMCSSKRDLTKVLEHMSGTIFKSNEIGEEFFRIGLTHLMSFKENRFVVEFSSLRAFVKFVLHIQLELQSYPDSVTFTVSPMIGRLSQTEIEEALNAVAAGPRYLSRLVEAADQLLSKTKSI